MARDAADTESAHCGWRSAFAGFSPLFGGVDPAADPGEGQGAPGGLPDRETNGACDGVEGTRLPVEM